MKALKSDLAKKVLADPAGKAKLREWSTTAARGQSAEEHASVVLESANSVRVYRPVPVPKAA
jgi:hypothetical protein